MLAARKSNTKLYVSFVTVVALLFTYAYRTEIKYFLYYKSPVPNILSKLRGEVAVDQSHVVTTIGGRLTLNGNFPFALPIIVSTLDTGVSKQIRAVGSWEYRNGAALLKLVKPGDTVVEIGANYGYYALLMGQALKGNGKIYAFEANPVVYDKLAQSVQLNGMQETIQLRNIAIADKSADAYIVYDTSDIGTGYLITDAEKLSTVQSPWVYKKIDTIPLSAALPADIGTIDVLRMDIEGSEYLVLMGAKDIIERNPNITIVTEWDNRYLKRFGAVEDLVNYLATQDFRFWSIDKQGLVELTAEQMKRLPTPRDVVISRLAIDI